MASTSVSKYRLHVPMCASPFLIKGGNKLIATMTIVGDRGEQDRGEQGGACLAFCRVKMPFKMAEWRSTEISNGCLLLGKRLRSFKTALMDLLPCLSYDCVAPAEIGYNISYLA